MSFLDRTPLGAGFTKGAGITGSERYLNRLCERAFLSLWTYPAVFRDQGKKTASGDGKEVCDLLVVFGRHILLFSDKDCAFPVSGDMRLDWSRWFRKAVMDSARQIWGAERWIRMYPERLFLDRACTLSFPIKLPDANTARFHRVVVTHGATERRRKEVGGNSCFTLAPKVVGAMHHDGSGNVADPFVVGQLDPARGYVHVVDDDTLELLLGSLDTAMDFIDYLEKKELLIETGKLGLALGEENLMANYLLNINAQGHRNFKLPANGDPLEVPEGVWVRLQSQPAWKIWLEALKVSYEWDRMIDRSARWIIAGVALRSDNMSAGDLEKRIRFMAAESRMARKQLAEAVMGLLGSARPTASSLRVGAIVRPTLSANGTVYAFLFCERPPSLSAQEYRRGRLAILHQHAIAAKAIYPDALDIIRYTTEILPSPDRTEDAVYIDARKITKELCVAAAAACQELGFEMCPTPLAV
jgi:hypothetical protein